LDRAFDESADWCRVDVIADGTGASQTRYGARRIEMPDGLRKHILRVSVAWAMTDIADHLAEYRSDVPEFCAYVSAEGMRCGSAAAEEIDDLAETLKGCDLDYEKKEKKEVFANLERLAGECRRLWGESCDHERI
jgi:hypothetical protein